jgi:peptide-methionine (S)-S-oxide reductase
MLLGVVWMGNEIAYFGAGCFWGVEAVFSKIEGVIKTRVGFMGGNVENPSYERVCGGDTGHVEVVKVEYDSSKVTYKELLEVFWKEHDPTQLDMQGPDVGKQYRSVIFYIDDKQRKVAHNSILEKQKDFNDKIVTAVEPAEEFYEAEEYHQKYIEKTGKKVC